MCRWTPITVFPGPLINGTVIIPQTISLAKHPVPNVIIVPSLTVYLTCSYEAASASFRLLDGIVYTVSVGVLDEVCLHQCPLD